MILLWWVSTDVLRRGGGFSKRFLLDSCVAGVAHSPFSLNSSFSSQAPIRRNLPAPFPPLNLAVMYVVSMFHLFASLVRPMWNVDLVIQILTSLCLFFNARLCFGFSPRPIPVNKWVASRFTVDYSVCSIMNRYNTSFSFTLRILLQTWLCAHISVSLHTFSR